MTFNFKSKHDNLHYLSYVVVKLQMSPLGIVFSLVNQLEHTDDTIYNHGNRLVLKY